MEQTTIQGQIKEARKAKGMTQQELASKTGLALRTIQRIESGNTEVSGHSLKQICHALNIPLERLVVSQIDHMRIEVDQVSGVRALYLSSLSFFINPVLGFVVPAVLGFSKSGRSAFYNRHFRFILVYHGFALFLIAVFFLLLFSGYVSVRRFPLGEFTFIFLIASYYLITALLMVVRAWMLKPRTSQRTAGARS